MKEKETELEQDGVEPVVETEEAEDVEETVVEVEEDDDDDEDEDDPEAIIEQLQDEKKELNNRVLRALADLENYKKRSARERQESIAYTKKVVFQQLLDVVDNFERAMTAATDPKDNFVIGVAMIQKQLADVLNQNGVTEIKAEGAEFDPSVHEAFAKEETAEHADNTIMEVFQKGFLINGSLLRPAKVKVAAAPAEEVEAEAEE